MSDQFKTALIRGVIWGFILAGGSFFGQLSTGGSYKAAWVAAGVVFFLSLATRTGIEGYIDTQAASPSKTGQSGQIGVGLLARLVLAVVVGVVAYLLCLLFGPLVADLKVSFAVTIGGWLVAYAGVLGLLAALWFFFSGGGLSLLRRP